MSVTEKEYSQFSLDIQDACNLTGLVNSWNKLLQSHPEFMPADHPATKLILDKFCDLVHYYKPSTQFSEAYRTVRDLLNED